MTIKIYDLTGADGEISFSPFCWRTKMALKHKGLDFETVPWRFTETDALAAHGEKRVPVMIDGDRAVGDSWAIALYLDEAYPDRPALMNDEAARAAARFTQEWANRILFAPLRPIAALNVLWLLEGDDATYFRTSRETALGAPLEEFCSGQAKAQAFEALKTTLKPIDGVLADHAFLGGSQPYYGDHIVFGTLCWPHMVCGDHALDSESPTAAWFERMLDLHGGYARQAPRAAA